MIFCSIFMFDIFPFFPSWSLSLHVVPGSSLNEFNAPSLHQVHEQRLQCRHQPSTTTTLSCFVHGGAAEAFKLVLHGTRLFTLKNLEMWEENIWKIEKNGNAIKTPLWMAIIIIKSNGLTLFSEYLRSKTHSQGTETIIDLDLQETSVHRLRRWHVSFWNAKEL